MSIYILIFFALMIFSLIEYHIGTISKMTYYFVFVSLFLFLAFRYGQGSDYFSYYYLYTVSHITEAGLISEYGEIGWSFVTAVLNTLSVPYEAFIFFVAAIDMYLLNRFICQMCPQRMTALFIAYPTLYLTYFFSALRQGIVIGIFLAFLLPMVLKKQYGKYIVLTLLCTLIHTASIIYLVVPIYAIIRKRTKLILVLTILAFIAGVVVNFTPLKSYIPYSDRDASITSILQRFMTYFIILFVYNKRYIADKENQKDLYNLICIYTCGLILFGVLFGSSVTASRTVAAFKCIEIAIFSLMVVPKSKYRQLSYAFVIMILGLGFVNNVRGYIIQGKYTDSVNLINYPYVSIFNEHKIDDYREDRYLDILKDYYIKDIYKS